MIPFDLFQHRLTPNTVVLEASAGTGKTFSLTALVLRILLEGLTDGSRPTLDEILLVTFTNKATDELRSRLRTRIALACRLWAVALPEEDLQKEAEKDGFLLAYHQLRLAYRQEDLVRLRAAEAVIDQAPVSTIHSFCSRVLAEFSGLIGLPPDVAVADDETERRAIASREAWRSVISCDPDAAVVSSIIENSEDETTLSPPIRFADLDNNYSAWISADRPFLPVDGEPDEVRSRWLEMTAEQRLTVAEAAWQAARLDTDISRRRTSARRVLLQRMDARLRLSCDRDGVVTMDGLQQHLRAALWDPRRRPRLIRDLRKRYPAVLIDEFQDTDPVQAAIFTAAFSGGFLRCIGDPKQSIYRFRGADLQAYIDFKNDLPCESMGTNFRSAPGCIAVVNQLFREERKPFLHDDVAFMPSDAGRKLGRLIDGDARHVVWWWLNCDKKPQAERQLTAAVASELRRLWTEARMLVPSEAAPYESEPFRPKHAAVLTATNKQAALVADALRAVGIPAINRSQENVCASEAARELATILACLADPSDGALARTALCTRLWGGTQALITASAKALAWDLATLRDLARSWRYLGVLGVVGRILRTQKTRERILGSPGGERFLTDLFHVAELAHAAGDRPVAVLTWLHNQREAGASGENARLRLEDDGDAVAVMTVHAAKGLEWPVVFAPFLWCTPKAKELRVTLKEELGKSRPICYRDVSGWIWDYRSQVPVEHGLDSDTNCRAEAVRQSYVALTRAAERCYIAWGPIGARASAAPARSGLAIIAGPACLEDANQRATRQAVATKNWLWPAQPEPSTVAAARILNNFPKGANKKLFLEKGINSNDWPTISKELKSFQFAFLNGQIYTPTGKSPDQIPTPPDAASFQEFLGATSGAGRQRVIDTPPAAVRVAQKENGAVLQPAQTAGVVQAPWSITSFTGLTRGAAEIHLFGAFADEAPGIQERTPALGIHAFPSGPGPGDCLHRIIEHADLRQPDSEKNRGQIRSLLARERIDPQVHETVVVGLLQELALCCIPGTTTPLAAIPSMALRHEWPFDLALSSPAGIAGLAAAFLHQADAVLNAAWAERVAALKRNDLAGFLNGRADLIACVDGRWWVIDWKSNWLGSSVDAYTPQALQTDALKHFYPLQWTLYLIALHRHLSARLLDYDPARHLGGAAYCYLRGLQQQNPTSGWLVHRPTPAFIAAIDAALGGNPPKATP